ncbi:MAG TPA: hypothetical protein EYP52_08950, partial [Anaerolineae bacterium]|nr:hypothetical protein [Anaerolineae bacterium]
RMAFGKPIIAKQAVGFKLADMAINIEAGRWTRALEAIMDSGRLGRGRRGAGRGRRADLREDAAG